MQGRDLHGQVSLVWDEYDFAPLMGSSHLLYILRKEVSTELNKLNVRKGWPMIECS